MHGLGTASLHRALRRCKEEALWQSSLHLLHCFRSIDVDAWDSAIVASGRATRWDVCLALLTQRWRVDTPHTWHSGEGNPGCGATISACSRVGHWPLALALLSVARSRRQPLGDSSCNAAISSCARVVAWSRALWILQEVPLANAEGYNASLAVCSKGRQWHLALQLLQRMVEAWRRPDAFTFSSLLAACHRSQRWEVAQGLLRDMPLTQVTPNIFSHCSLLTSYVKVYRWVQALEVFCQELCSREPNLVAYTVALQALQVAGPQWTVAARRLAKQMGGAQDVVSYSTSQWASDFAPLPLAERTFRRTIFAAATRLSLQCLRTAVAETMPETAPESVPDMGVFSRDLLETCWMGRCGKSFGNGF